LPTLGEGARRGDAIAATDTGHRGNGFDASWAPGNPVALADYGWRSIKATREAADALVHAYYRRDPHHHYFMGCSNGGRMALMAAARWPQDWDGVIAGAPANPWTVQLRNFGAVQDAMRAPGGWIGTAERAQTDLSPPQRATLNVIVAAGYAPAAITADDWTRWVANPDRTPQSQLTFAEQSRTYLFKHFSDEALVADLDVQPGDLQAFRDRGGKILSYFGSSDPVMAPGLGVDWYDAVQAATRGRTADFYRLFLIPGMSHCQGGAAATSFGQSLDAPAVRQDREHDVRLAMEAWAERGIAPSVLKSEAGSKRTVVRRLR
jgi:feruloyl esterase